MKEIKISKGYTVLVDDEDFDLLNSFTWSANESRRNVYARRKVKESGLGRKSPSITMHRMILNLEDKHILTDHIDGNGLNNQKNNLRISNHSQNGANRKVNTKKISNFLGVYKVKTQWIAGLRKNNVLYRVGCYTEIDAAKAYNDLAIKHHGSFARLNVI